MADTRASLDRVLQLLANPHHREILIVLAEQPERSSSIAARLELGRDSVSHALHRLREMDLVAFESRAKYHVYRLTEHVVIDRRGSGELSVTVCFGASSVHLSGNGDGFP